MAGGEHLPLTQLLIDRYTASHKHQAAPGTGLVASWEYSLRDVVEALNERGLGGVEVMVEYKLPYMDGDIDVILAGYHPTTDEPSYVLIELKQWDSVTVSPENPVAVHAGFPKVKLHPVRQVQRYCEHLMHSYALLRGRPERLAGVALLHNATDQVKELLKLPQSDHGRLYTLGTMEKFKDFLAARLSSRPGGQAAEMFCNAKEVPPPTSSEAFSRVGSPHPVFALQREQEIAFQEVRETIRAAEQGRRKKVVIVRGGPGSGKTGVAVELLRSLRQEGIEAVHASGSRAFTENLRTAATSGPLKSTKAQAARDYRFFNQFGSAVPDSVEVLICDEAHRIRRTSTNFRTPKEKRDNARAQADELIAVAQVPVFLLDDWQSLRPDEVGTTKYLVERAKAAGCEWVVIDLPGMFRAGGSVEFRRWVTHLLSLDGATPTPWVPDGRMTVKIAESPSELEAFLHKQIETNNAQARMTAGFCWDWKKPKDGEGVRLEVRIGDWHRPWNTRVDVIPEDLPVTSMWATDPRGFRQIGCIYTAQNFEFDWSGVIIGRDLLWRNGRFIVDRTQTRDGELRKKAVSDEDVDRLVRNAYHVLLTRGRLGTVLYSEDEETLDKLRDLVVGTVGNPLAKSKKPALPKTGGATA
ncbi:DNA/RNA helicase domain-containing protein [Kitasatospora sp. NPDC086009]|uniref:DNA/RNA helicase domain-containing protein n=1 Tax=unclassified Kitasatospora TaxID=2633591 RepID=UPI0037C99B37